MWVYLGSSCLDRPSLEDLSAAKVETRIRKVLDSAVVPLRSAGPDPL
jgi:hypothetical protein